MANADLHQSHDLIASDMVVGTSVYDMNGNNIGPIERIILEKRGGRVAYAVLSFGGAVEFTTTMESHLTGCDYAKNPA